MIMVGDLLDDVLADLMRPLERYEVLNREPRERFDPYMWHLIYERDGYTCWVCQRRVPKGAGEIDHLVPRSSFLPDELSSVADRSWNLRVCCTECNQEKSNFRYSVLPRTFGVTRKCWYCEDGTSGRLGDPRELPVHAYCGSCSIVSRVPNESWVM